MLTSAPTEPQLECCLVFADPFDVLEEGQIQFKSSEELKDPLTETNVYSIHGPVLVRRYFILWPET
jgi:RNA-dependent RNA polymerase